MFEKEFAILGIEKTRDENAVRNAYRSKLVVTNPEDKPEEFKQLRAAYEAALLYVKNGEPKEDEESVFVTEGLSEDSDVRAWMEQVNDICQTPELRYSEEEWQKLLSADVVNGFDTSEEAAKALFQYLMEHYFQSSRVYRMLDEKFDIKENEQEWREKLPSGFMDYVLDKISDETGETDYSFEWLKGEKTADFDGFIRNIEYVNTLLWEKKQEEAAPIFKEMESAKVWHPFYDLLKLRYQLMMKQTLTPDEKTQMTAKMEQLLAEYPTSRRIPLECGELYWQLGEKEAMFRVYTELSQRDHHYLIDKCLALYAFEKGNIEEAEKHINEMESIDEDFIEDRSKIDRAYLSLGVPQSLEGLRLYLNACLRQERKDEIERMAAEHPLFSEIEDAEYLWFFCNREDNPKEAAKHMIAWIDKLLPSNDREDAIKLYNALFEHTKYCVDQHKKGVFTDDSEVAEVLKRIERWENFGNGENKRNIPIKYQKNLALLEIERNLEALECAQELIQLAPNHLQIIAVYQRSARAMYRAQEVVDLYHRGVEAVDGEEITDELREAYESLFVNAAEVFHAYNQMDDLIKVVEDAKSHGVDSDALLVLELAVNRRKCYQDGTLKNVLAQAEALVERLKAHQADKSLLAEVYFYRAILLADLGELPKEEVLEAFDLTVRTQAKTRYLFAQGNYRMECKKYKEALDNYRRIQRMEGYSALIYEKCAECLHSDNNSLEALNYVREIEQNEQELDDYYRLFADIYLECYIKTNDDQYFTDVEKYCYFVLNQEREQGKETGEYHAKLAQALFRVDRIDEALERAQRACELTPNLVAALWIQGRCYVQKGEYEKAVEFFKKMLKAYSSENNINWVSKAMVLKEDDSDLETWFQYAIANSSPSFKRLQYECWINDREARGKFVEELELIEQKRAARLYESEQDYKMEMLSTSMLRFMDGCENEAQKAELLRFLKGKEEIANTRKKAEDYLEVAQDYLCYTDNLDEAYRYFELSILTDVNEFDVTTAAYMILSAKENGREDLAQKWKTTLLMRWKLAANTEDEEAAIQRYIQGLKDRRARLFLVSMFFAAVGESKRARDFLEQAYRSKNCKNIMCNFCTEDHQTVALILEAEGDYERAEKVYEEIENKKHDAYSGWRRRVLRQKLAILGKI